MADGAPNPRACVSDTDCVADTVTDVSGCCVVRSTPIAQSSAYHRWLGARRSGPECAAAACVVIDPSPPLDCESAAHCAAGQCANECREAPGPSAPPS